MVRQEEVWARHYQEPWKEDAANPRYPLALRVAFLAFGMHRANGHARFRQREIANVLGRFDDQGTWHPADRRTVNRAIKTAIDYGLLADGSKALCLIVPRHRVSGGLGNENARCDRHPRPTPAHLKAVS